MTTTNRFDTLIIYTVILYLKPDTLPHLLLLEAIIETKQKNSYYLLLSCNNSITHILCSKI